MIGRTTFILAVSALTIACFGATEDPVPEGSQTGSVTGNPEQEAPKEAESPKPGETAPGTPTAGGGTSTPAPPKEQCGGPPPTARCIACPWGYLQVNGEPTCGCCTGPNGEVCGAQGEIKCTTACQGGSYKHKNGVATCDCCIAPVQVCGGPPPNAKCASACPKGYKQIDGKPTCECCT